MAEKVKIMQHNWIGISIGAEINFLDKENKIELKIFTTRPDNIYGATFIALSVNHPLVKDILNKNQIEDIKEQFSKIDDDKEKIGVNLNTSCIHPITGVQIPIYIANFVLDNYGEEQYLGVLHMMKEIMILQKYNFNKKL